MKLVRESISFQRYKDPKRALGVGARVLIEEWLEEMSVENYVINDDLTIDVNGRVNLSHKNLSSFPEYIKFRNVSGYFFCDNNQLTSLEGCPSTVEGFFYCDNNQLTSLEGCPSNVRESFSCNNNQLISLKGCPSSVGRSFFCNNNQLTSLEGCPSTVGGSFFCRNNKKQFSEEEVRKYCKVKGNIYDS